MYLYNITQYIKNKDKIPRCSNSQSIIVGILWYLVPTIEYTET